MPDPAPRRRRPHPPPAPQPLSWLERGRRSPRLVGGLLRTGHRCHHGTTHPHRPTAQQARQIQQDPGPPRPPPPHHVVPAGIRTSSSTSGVGDRRKRPRRGARHIAPRRASPPASSLPVLRRAAPPQSLLFLPSQAGCSGIREPASRAPMSPPLTAPAPPPACNLCLGHLLTRNTRSCSRRLQRKRGTCPRKERTTWPAVLRTTPGLREPEPSPAVAGAREAAPAVAGAH